MELNFGVGIETNAANQGVIGHQVHIVVSVEI